MRLCRFRMRRELDVSSFLFCFTAFVLFLELAQVCNTHATRVSGKPAIFVSDESQTSWHPRRHRQANLTLTPSHPFHFPRRQYPFVVVTEFSTFLIKRPHPSLSANDPPTFSRLDLSVTNI